MLNQIKTSQQGKFIDQPQYFRWTEKQKQRADTYEKRLVRPDPTENAICQCETPFYAEWIASRLNLASELEQMTYDYAMGKTSGQEIIEFVKSNLE